MKNARIAVLLCLSASCFSTPWFSEAGAAEWKTSFGAEIEAEGLHWTQGALGPDRKTTRGIFSAKAPFTIRNGRAWRLRAQPVVQYDPGNASKNERLFKDLPELYLQYQSLPWTLQLGLNTFTWGDTDVFNPLDVLNARRYFDPFRPEKLGAPSLVVKREFEKFFVEAVYIPWQRKTLIPGENSRWLPRDVYRVRSLTSSIGEARLLLPANVNFRYLKDAEVSNALQNNVALRFKFRFEGFDWTVAGFQGASVSPDVRLADITVVPISVLGGVTTLSVNPNIALQATSYPIRMTGTSFTKVVGPLLVKGASAYTHVINRRYDLPARIWENALGTECTFGVGNGTMTALLQGTYVDRGDGIESSSLSLARMFDRAAMGALRWAPSETWTATASYLRDLRFKGSLVHSEATYKIADGWRAKVAADLLSGRTETPLGAYGRNDRVTASVLAQF